MTNVVFKLRNCDNILLLNLKMALKNGRAKDAKGVKIGKVILLVIISSDSTAFP